MEDREHTAAASIAGLTDRYAHSDRPSWNSAMQEIQDQLRVWEIRPKRIREVLSMAATGYLDNDCPRVDLALQLLVDAGADLQRARLLRNRIPPHRVVGLGHAGPLPSTRAA